jgi:hypothetical protein
MDQQDYSNNLSTALDLPSNSQWKLRLMTLSFLNILFMKRGFKLAYENVPETYSYRSLSALQLQPPISNEKGSHS